MQAQQQFVEQQSRTQNGGHTPASNMLQNPAAVTRSQVISNPQVGGRGNHVPGTVQHQTQQIAGPIPIAPGQPLNVLNRDLGRFNPAHMGPMHHRAQQFAQPLGPQITPPLPQPGHTQQQGVTRRSPQDQQAAAQMLTGMPFIYNMTPSQHLQPEGAEHGGP
ncbi:hypothetical protein BD410DRAFT_7428 [Rickenella mellea]|uniref:Uncharacterized protein n=1 Tax=Rickenella mellea TaxID=50990 RepID=A0A4R5XDN6_9AGAM|nr:hypothetical protein BD410DRAFT_7428 [Rickenella mellea]